MTDETSNDDHLLIEEVNLLMRPLADAQYKALRYHTAGYNHLKDDTLDEIEDIRGLCDEILERHRSPGLDEIVSEVIEDNPAAWEEYVSGGAEDRDAGAENYLVGKVMQVSGGRFDPGEIYNRVRDRRREDTGTQDNDE